METQGLTQVEIMILYSACLRPRFGAHMLGPIVHSGPKMEPNNGPKMEALFGSILGPL